MLTMSNFFSGTRMRQCVCGGKSEMQLRLVVANFHASHGTGKVNNRLAIALFGLLNVVTLVTCRRNSWRELSGSSASLHGTISARLILRSVTSSESDTPTTFSGQDSVVSFSLMNFDVVSTGGLSCTDKLLFVRPRCNLEALIVCLHLPC